VALSPSALPGGLDPQARGSQWHGSQYPAAIDHVTMCHNVQPVAKCSQWHGFIDSTDVRHL